MTQNEKILQYIQDFGSITTLQAFRDIGCTRLSGRIYDLKKQGHKFNREFVTSKNRYGENISYIRYSLKSEV
jgi:hypothetical protein